METNGGLKVTCNNDINFRQFIYPSNLIVHLLPMLCQAVWQIRHPKEGLSVQLWLRNMVLLVHDDVTTPFNSDSIDTKSSRALIEAHSNGQLRRQKESLQNGQYFWQPSRCSCRVQVANSGDVEQWSSGRSELGV